MNAGGFRHPLQDSAELLTPLQGLGKLHGLHLDTASGASHGVGTDCELTGLRSLTIEVPCRDDSLLFLQLTQLQHLTSLSYCGPSIDQANVFCPFLEVELTVRHRCLHFGASFAKTLEFFPHTDTPCLQTTVLGHALRNVLLNLTQLVLNSALTSSILDVAPPLVGVTILHHCMHRESCAKQHYKDSHKSALWSFC